MLHLERLLPEIVALADRAGAVILEHYHGDVVVRAKADASPVTVADEAAEAVILARLAELTPEIPVVAEETVAAGHVPDLDDGPFWLVDPLDGTKEFLSRNGEFTVNIALIEGDAPVLGVVYAPAIDALYVSGRGLGASKYAPGAGAQRLSSVPAAPGTPLIVAESRSHPSPELEAYLATIPVARRISAGSSLKFCLVAEGAADIYPRFGPTMEWDTAAGDCVFRYSGRDGERASPLRYNTPDLRNPSFVIGL
jgi:3'(2'), 5'-bisphosphate nucleotidase